MWEGWKYDLLLMGDPKAVEEGTRMFAFYTREMAALDKAKVYSKPITQCIDYIYHHLHKAIRMKDLTNLVSLNESYLSTLFKNGIW